MRSSLGLEVPPRAGGPARVAFCGARRGTARQFVENQTIMAFRTTVGIALQLSLGWWNNIASYPVERGCVPVRQSIF